MSSTVLTTTEAGMKAVIFNCKFGCSVPHLDIMAAVFFM